MYWMLSWLAYAKICASLTLDPEINTLSLDPFCSAHLCYFAYKCLDGVVSARSLQQS